MQEHRGIHKNCVISNIRWDISHMEKVAFDVTDDEGKTDTIRIRNHDAIDRFRNLRDGKRSTAYFDFGMTDIDIDKDLKGNYMIMNSPVDGIYDYYEVPDEEFQKLIA